MTLLDAVGFEYEGTIAALTRAFPGASIDAGVTIGTGRNNVGSAFYASTVSSNWTMSVTSSGTLIVGFAIQATDPTTGTLCELTAAGVQQIRLEITDTAAGYTIAAKVGGTTIGTTQELLNGAWYYLEWKVALATGATGTCQIKINESLTGGVNASSVITAATTTSADGVKWTLQKQSAPASEILDDVVILNTSGAVNNDFIGDQSVELRLPDADGASSQWTTSSGSAHWSLVDDSPGANDDTDYVQTAVNGNVDLFGVPDLQQITGNITGVIVRYDVRLLAAGSRNVRAKHRHTDGTISNGSTVTVSSTAYATAKQVWESNPGTAAPWAVADVNGGQFGIEAVA